MTKQLASCVAYLRKSTKGIDKQEHSIERQQIEIQSLAKVKGYKVIRWYIDDGISGWKSKAQRKQFGKMIDDLVRLKDAKIILTDSLDRFSRQTPQELQAEILPALQAGLETIIVRDKSYNVSLNSPMGEFLQFIIEVFANQEYVKKIGRTTLQAKRNRAQQGKTSGGRAAYGLRIAKDGSYKPGPANERKVVNWIFEQYVSGMGAMGIAYELNQQKVSFTHGKQWGRHTIRHMLQNLHYIGTFTFNRKSQGRFYGIDANNEVVEKHKCQGGKQIEIKGAFEPVVDPHLFAKAQQRHAQLRASNLKPKRKGHLLSGVLFCSHCGGKMNGVLAKRDNCTYYRCTNYYDKRICRAYSVKEELLVQPIVDEISKLLEGGLTEQLIKPLSGDGFDFTDAWPNSKTLSDVEVLRQQIADLERKIEEGCETVLTTRNKTIRQKLDAKLDAWQKELDQCRKQEKKVASSKVTAADVIAVVKDMIPITLDEFGKIQCSRQQLGEGLRMLGAKISIRFKTVPYGNREHHIPVKMRVQLGQKRVNCNINSVEDLRA